MGHLYIDNLGDSEKYYPFYWKKNSIRSEHLEEDREKLGFDRRECWNLDKAFYIWLYERLCYFKDTVKDIVDLEYHVFEYEGEELTQLACIDKMIDGCKVYFEDCDTNDALKIKQILDVPKIWSLVIGYMWW